MCGVCCITQATSCAACTRSWAPRAMSAPVATHSPAMLLQPLREAEGQLSSLLPEEVVAAQPCSFTSTSGSSQGLTSLDRIRACRAPLMMKRPKLCAVLSIQGVRQVPQGRCCVHWRHPPWKSARCRRHTRGWPHVRGTSTPGRQSCHLRVRHARARVSTGVCGFEGGARRGGGAGQGSVVQ